MKFAITGDSHVHAYAGAQSRMLADGTNSRLRDTLDALWWVADSAKRAGCEAVLHGGDLFHSRRSESNETWSRAGNVLRDIRELIPLWVLVGNHDMNASGDGTSTVEALEGIIHAVTVSEVREVAGFPVGWLPYTEDPAVVRDSMARLHKAGARVVVAHLGIGDPKLSSCVPTDYEVPGRINVSDLGAEQFDHVFMSHYHTAQDVAPNARYAGSPLQLTFKDAGQPKGYWVYDTDRPDAPEFVENTSSPRFHKLEAGKGLDEALGSVRRDDFLWVTGASRDLADSLRSRRPADAAEPRIDTVSDAPQVTARISEAARSEGQVLDEYVRAVDAAADDTERAALVRLGKELVDAAGANHG